MKPYLIRLIIAIWFMGMVAFAVWGAPVQSKDMHKVRRGWFRLVVLFPCVLAATPPFSFTL